MSFKHRSAMQGFSLIEVLVGTAIFSTMLLGVGALSLQSLKMTKIALDKTVVVVQEKVVEAYEKR